MKRFLTPLPAALTAFPLLRNAHAEEAANDERLVHALFATTTRSKTGKNYPPVETPHAMKDGAISIVRGFSREWRATA
jgi:hypothetical protein